MSDFQLPKTVLSRNGKKKGRVTGGTRLCGLEGCRGLQIGVRWPDGKLTWPCSKGLKEIDSETWQIE